jgi:ribonuclease HII
MLICGIDEAGKGSVFGNLCIACYVIDSHTDYNAKDSKKLSKKKRDVYYNDLVDKAVEISVYELTADDLNIMHDQGMTIIDMEIWAIVQLLNNLQNKPVQVFIDSCDVNHQRFGKSISDQLVFETEVHSAHKADDLFKVVSAASIVAKTFREQNVSSLHVKYGSHIGTGYPCDMKTKTWLTDYYKTHLAFPIETRLFWKTIDSIKKNVISTD